MLNTTLALVLETKGEDTITHVLIEKVYNVHIAMYECHHVNCTFYKQAHIELQFYLNVFKRCFKDLSKDCSICKEKF